jgi:hypothetical protein
MHACRCLKEFDKNTGNVSTNRKRGISRAVLKKVSLNLKALAVKRPRTCPFKIMYKGVLKTFKIVYPGLSNHVS